MMDKTQLTLLNVGDNLDQLMNLDPRGYGVCRILYAASREYTGKPLTINAAEKLASTLHSGDLAYILTGFVLRPHGSAETDGMVSSVLLARALVLACDAKPVIVCAPECLQAARAMAQAAGLHWYGSVEELRAYPASLA
ncbi:MAG: DUF4392 domain-containing protein, partial [Treponema sp.]|nr:DUF4392 domain-containing protein [Treponema sp.]